MSKPWDRKPKFGRREGTRPQRDRILIVCEGKCTEPNYFKAFPVQPELAEVDIEGTGANTSSLVEEAIRLKELAVCRGKPYNQVWCVFDRDIFPATNFNNAFRLANSNRIRTAFSNQCFELWYFLHFSFNDAALHRHDYGQRLSSLLGKRYKKNDEGMYDLVKSRQGNAIRNAKRLLTLYQPFCNPERDDPSTTVHLLVEVLNEFIS